MSLVDACGYGAKMELADNLVYTRTWGIGKNASWSAGDKFRCTSRY